MNSLGKLRLWNPELKLKLHHQTAPRTELIAPEGGVEVRNTPDHFVVSESRGCDQRVSYVAAQGGEMHG